MMVEGHRKSTCDRWKYLPSNSCFAMMVQLQNNPRSCNGSVMIMWPDRNMLCTAGLFQTALVRFAGNALEWRHGSLRYAALFGDWNGKLWEPRVGTRHALKTSMRAMWKFLRRYGPNNPNPHSNKFGSPTWADSFRTLTWFVVLLCIFRWLWAALKTCLGCLKVRDPENHGFQYYINCMIWGYPHFTKPPYHINIETTR